MSRTLFLVAYDIQNPTRLRKMLRILKDFASGGQKSAFECYLSPGEKKELLARTENVMDVEKDALFLIRMSGKGAIETLGVAVKPMDEDYIYIG